MRIFSVRVLAHLRRRDAETPTRPLDAALPCLLAAALVLVSGFGAAIEGRSVVAVAGGLVAVGVLQAARAALERDRRRHLANEWLLWGAAARPSSALLSWRAAGPLPLHARAALPQRRPRRPPERRARPAGIATGVAESRAGRRVAPAGVSRAGARRSSATNPR